MTDEPAVPTFGPPPQPTRFPGAGQAPARPDNSQLRVGDHDRMIVIEQLTRHCAEGRLGFDELDDRISRAWSARTQSDLRSVEEDLPALMPVTESTPSVKSWLADGRALLMTVPPRLLIAAAAAIFVLLTFFTVLASVFGFDHGLGGGR